MAWLGLAGKRAVVTGGSSGIGRATALGLLRAGVHVTIVDIIVEKALAELAAEGGGNLAGRIVDVSQHDSVSAAWEAIGPAHILVNSAGITRDGWLTKMDPGAQWDDVMAVNLKGTFLMTQGFAKQWIASGLGQGADASGASIVNIASMVGKNGNLGQANYAASKAGVIGFTKTAAKELARDAVRCNVVLPGFITTPMTAAVPEKVLQRIIPTVPMARMGEAEDIANAALFLASDRSSYMTGAVVEVSGGLNM